MAKAPRHLLAVDAALAGVLLLLGELAQFTGQSALPRWAGVALTAVYTAPLAARRLLPIPVGLVTVAGVVALGLLDPLGMSRTIPLAVALAAFTLGAHVPSRTAGSWQVALWSRSGPACSPPTSPPGSCFRLPRCTHRRMASGFPCAPVASAPRSRPSGQRPTNALGSPGNCRHRGPLVERGDTADAGDATAPRAHPRRRSADTARRRAHRAGCDGGDAAFARQLVSGPAPLVPQPGLALIDTLLEETRLPGGD